MPRPFELELLLQHEDVCALLAYANVNINVWFKAGDEVAVRAMEAPVQDRWARFPRGIATVHMITEGADLPSPGARGELVRTIRKWNSRTSAVGVVIERAGFAGSAMRGAVTGIQLLAKVDFPVRVSQSIAEIADWLPGPNEERAGVSLPRDGLYAALQKARKHGLDRGVL